MLGTLKVMDASGHLTLEVHESAEEARESKDEQAQVIDVEAAIERFRSELNDKRSIAFLVGTPATPVLPPSEREKVKHAEDYNPEAHYLIVPAFQGG